MDGVFWEGVLSFLVFFFASAAIGRSLRVLGMGFLGVYGLNGPGQVFFFGSKHGMGALKILGLLVSLLFFSLSG